MPRTPHRLAYYATSAAEFPPEAWLVPVPTTPGMRMQEAACRITQETSAPRAADDTPFGGDYLRLVSTDSVLCQAYRLTLALNVLRPSALLCCGDSALAPARLAGWLSGTPVLLHTASGSRSTKDSTWRGGLLHAALSITLKILPIRSVSKNQLDDPDFRIRRTSWTNLSKAFSRLIDRGVVRLVRRYAPGHAYLSALQATALCREFAKKIMDCDSYASHHLDHEPDANKVIEHYLAVGCFLGYRMHPLFWDEWYLQTYSDAQVTGLSAWEHYCTRGASEDRNPNPFFESKWYRSKNGLDSQTDPLLHYVSQPANAMADPSPLFDSRWYAERYSELINPGVSLLADFMGAREPRCPHPIFLRHPSLTRDIRGRPLDMASLFSARFNYLGLTASRAEDDVDSVRRRYCLCTVITGGYDAPAAPEYRDDHVDYVLLTDRQITNSAGWDRVIVVEPTADPIQQSRYLKMHLADAIQDSSKYEVLGYIDGYIALTGSVTGFFDEFARSGRAVGLVPHPERNCAYQEAAAALLRQADSDANIWRAVAFLEEQGHPEHAGLFEMGFFMFRNGDVARLFFAEWWRLFERLGNRDQLLVPHVVRRQSLDYFPLLPRPLSVRSVPPQHPSFALRGHLPDTAPHVLATGSGTGDIESATSPSHAESR